MSLKSSLRAMVQGRWKAVYLGAAEALYRSVTGTRSVLNGELLFIAANPVYGFVPTIPVFDSGQEPTIVGWYEPWIKSALNF
jgi:hypothetical protein